MTMGNVIKRDTVFIEVMTMTSSSAYEPGEAIGIFKDVDYGWTSKDSKGNWWHMFIDHIRNENFYKVINQYSMSDIVYYLQERNSDYYTVMWDILVDAIKTTFRETKITCIDDIYKYIATNLI